MNPEQQQPQNLPPHDPEASLPPQQPHTTQPVNSFVEGSPQPQQPSSVPVSGPGPQAAPPNGAPQSMPQQQQHTPQSDQTDTLGLVSIILAVVGMQLIGLILGIIGNSKAKKEGYSNKLSKIGIILNSVFMVLGALFFIFFVLMSFRAAQETASEINDTVTVKNNVNLAYQGLEVYYNEYGYYPEDLSVIANRSADEPGLVTTSIEEAADEIKTSAVYTYSPESCEEQKCESYELSGDTADGVYSKSALN